MVVYFSYVVSNNYVRSTLVRSGTSSAATWIIRKTGMSTNYELSPREHWGYIRVTKWVKCLLQIILWIRRYLDAVHKQSPLPQPVVDIPNASKMTVGYRQRCVALPALRAWGRAIILFGSPFSLHQLIKSQESLELRGKKGTKVVILNKNKFICAT